MSLHLFFRLPRLKDSLTFLSFPPPIQLQLSCFHPPLFCHFRYQWLQREWIVGFKPLLDPCKLLGEFSFSAVIPPTTPNQELNLRSHPRKKLAHLEFSPAEHGLLHCFAVRSSLITAREYPFMVALLCLNDTNL